MIKDSTFSGSVAKSSSCDYYAFRINGKVLWLCHGDLYQAVGGPEVSMKTKHSVNWGWGYEGDDPDILSITLLALALGLEWDGKDSSGILPLLGHQGWFAFASGQYYGRYPLNKEYPQFKMPAYCGDVPGLIRQLFKKFTAEVVSNFGDTWSMTTEEILQWVDKQQQTKGKTNERDNTETKGAAS